MQLIYRGQSFEYHSQTTISSPRRQAINWRYAAGINYQPLSYNTQSYQFPKAINWRWRPSQDI